MDLNLQREQGEIEVYQKTKNNHIALFLILIFLVVRIAFLFIFSVDDELYKTFYIIQEFLTLILTFPFFWIAIKIFGKEHFIKSYVLAGLIVGPILLSGISFLILSPADYFFAKGSLFWKWGPLVVLLTSIIYLIIVRNKDYFFTSAKTSFVVGILLTIPFIILINNPILPVERIYSWFTSSGGFGW